VEVAAGALRPWLERMGIQGMDRAAAQQAVGALRSAGVLSPGQERERLLLAGGEAAARKYGRIEEYRWAAARAKQREKLLDDALAAYHEAYHGEFPQGGDAADHDNAHREGVLAVLVLPPGQPSLDREEMNDELYVLRGRLRGLEQTAEFLLSKIERSTDWVSIKDAAQPLRAALSAPPEEGERHG
jgi:hypothetical protein